MLEKESIDIFERDELSEDGKYIFNESCLGPSDFLEFVGKSTRRNQTFLGSAVSQNVETLQEAYDWFADTLQLVGVELHAGPSPTPREPARASSNMPRTRSPAWTPVFAG